MLKEILAQASQIFTQQVGTVVTIGLVGQAGMQYQVKQIKSQAVKMNQQAERQLASQPTPLKSPLKKTASGTFYVGDEIVESPEWNENLGPTELTNFEDDYALVEVAQTKVNPVLRNTIGLSRLGARSNQAKNSSKNNVDIKSPKKGPKRNNSNLEKSVSAKNTASSNSAVVLPVPVALQ